MSENTDRFVELCYLDKGLICTALSTIINCYDKPFGYEDFERTRIVMPWIIEFTFRDIKFVGIEQYNFFQSDKRF